MEAEWECNALQRQNKKRQGLKSVDGDWSQTLYSLSIKQIFQPKLFLGREPRTLNAGPRLLELLIAFSCRRERPFRISRPSTMAVLPWRTNLADAST